jgi:hypothetical protein
MVVRAAHQVRRRWRDLVRYLPLAATIVAAGIGPGNAVDVRMPRPTPFDQSDSRCWLRAVRRQSLVGDKTISRFGRCAVSDCSAVFRHAIVRIACLLTRIWIGDADASFDVQRAAAL